MAKKIIKYTETYEYISVTGKSGTVGISEEAAGKLGDIYLVELPEVGKGFKKDDEIGLIESVKTAADVYSPVSGKVTEVNKKLEAAPELVSKSPMKDGWLFKLEISDPGELDSLMDAKTFKKYINESGRW
jgi:glycine cleavage system H protein